MSTLSLSTRFTLSEDQVSCDLAGEAVILNLKSGKYFGLNEVGARIWDLLKERRTPETILSVLVEEYEVDLEQCKQDLMELLHQLTEQGLIYVEGS